MADYLSEPRLRIETGAHQGRVLGFDLDASGSLLLTASDDKTARLWSVPTLQSLGVLRPPFSEDPDGKLYAAALSKDGSMGAVGGFSWGPLTIHVFVVARCEIVRQVSLPKVVGEVVRALRFSPDRTLLVVGTDGPRLVVISVADWAIINRPAGGGALETVVPGLSGELFGEQGVASLRAAVTAFDPDAYDTRTIRAHAEAWDTERFVSAIRRIVDEVAGE